MLWPAFVVVSCPAILFINNPPILINGFLLFSKTFFFQWMYVASFHHLSHGQAISHDIVQVPAIIVKKNNQ